MGETSFIYALIDPRDRLIRYVGKAVNPYRRVNGHRRGIWLEKHDYKTNWLRELGVRPDVIILEAVGADWEERERFWIQSVKGRGHNLTNWTPGGEGFTAETSQKVLTPEVRTIISQKSKERWQDPTYRAMTISRMRGSSKGIPKSPEHREKIRQHHEIQRVLFKGEGNPFHGRRHTEETKRLLAEKARARLNSPERRAFVEENCRKMRETYRLWRTQNVIS